jgi:hypothetical protein
MKYALKIGTKTLVFAAIGIMTNVSIAQKAKFTSGSSGVEETKSTINPTFTKADVDFDYFEEVTAQAKKHRSKRLIDFKKFLEFSKEEGTIILDTRSKRMYDKMHIKGAIHINFSDFTQDYLAEMISSKDTRILIYCNNNFYQEPVFKMPFPTKAMLPSTSFDLFNKDERPKNTLALNIPTYINLFGYEYRNVYELSELVSSKQQGLEMSGSDVKKLKPATQGGY